MPNKNKQRLGRHIIYAIGVILITFTSVSDLIRKRPYQLGIAQLFVLFLGFGFILLGIYLPKLLTKKQKIVKQFPKFMDLVIVAGFIIYAFLFFWGKWDGLTPTIDFSSDASVITSFVVAYDHPDFFTQDLLLRNPEYGAQYQLFLIPVLSFITRMSHDYSLSFLILLPISIALQLSGFFLLGKKLFNNRILAITLTILCAINIQFGAGDYWGFFSDPQPRFIYQSIFPFILLWFFNSLEKPRRWPLIMFMIGILGYVHLLSNSAIALMIWVSFFFNKPPAYSNRKLAQLQLINAMVYLLTTIPVILVIHSTSSYNYFVDIPYIVSKYYVTLQNLGINIIILIFALFFLVYNKRIDPVVKNLTIWIFSLLFYALLVPLIEFKNMEISALNIIPLDVIRNLRYTLPLLYILLFHTARVVVIKIREVNKPKSITVGSLMAIILLFFSINIVETFKNSAYYFKDYAVQALSCFQTKKLFCPSRYESDATEVLRYIKEITPTNSKILAAPYSRLDEQIRYGSQRTSSLVQSDAPRLPQEVTHTLQEYYEKLAELSNTDGWEQLDGSIKLACRLDADFLLLSQNYPLELFNQTNIMTLVFQNDHFLLVKINTCLN